MRNPQAVSSNKLCHDILFDLWSISRYVTRLLLDVQPGLFKRRLLVAAMFARDEDDFKLAPVEIISDHDLMTVSLQRSASFGYQERWISFELRGHK